MLHDVGKVPDVGSTQELDVQYRHHTGLCGHLSLKGTYRQDAYICAGLPALFIRSPLTQSSAGQGSNGNHWEHTRLNLFEEDGSHHRHACLSPGWFHCNPKLSGALSSLLLQLPTNESVKWQKRKYSSVKFCFLWQIKKTQRVSSENSRALLPSHLFANLKRIHSHSQLNPFNSEV